MPPAEPFPPPPSLPPNQFPGESLTSPLNPNHDSSVPIDDDDTDTNPGKTPFHPLGIDHSGQPPPAGWRALSYHLRRRNNRPAKYPAPLNRWFDHLELWKVCALFLAVFGAIATFVNLNLISKLFMRILLLLITVATFFFMVAHTLQDILPEVAVVAMLIGIASLIALFHSVVLNLLHLPERVFRLAVSVLVLAYGFLLLGVTLFKIIKEDVREKENEDIEKNRSAIDNPSSSV